MGSIRFDGVRFAAYAADHEPRHVHGFYADLEAIVDLRIDGSIALSSRKDSVRPSTGSKADAQHVLRTAARNFDALVALWEAMHG